MNPWTARKVAEAKSELLAKLVIEKDKRIAVLEQQRDELKALFNKTSAFTVVEQTEDGVKLKMKPIAQAASVRGGFRGKVAQREQQTHSKENDSVGQLERRVESEAR